MEFRIVKLDEFKIVGYKINSTNDLMKGMRDCPAFWKKVIKEKKNEKLLPLTNQEPLGLLGAIIVINKIPTATASF